MQSRSLLHAVIDGISDAVFVKDIHGRYTTINAAGAALLGRSPAEIVGRDDSQLLQPDHAARAAQSDQRVLAEQQPITFEEAIHTPEGPRTYLITKMPHRNEAGEVIGVVGICRDITQSKRADEALRDSESRMRDIVDSVVDGILTIDDRGNVESLNPAAQRIFGYSAEEVIGRNVKMLMPSPYHEEHDQYLRNYMTTGQRKIIGIGREVVGRRKDGSVFPLDLAVSEVKLGRRRIFTGIVRDITARKQAEEELRQAKEVAEAANKAKDHFLAVLSHELRTPLTPVLATMTFVEGKPDLPAELRTEISSIRRNVEMEAKLIDDLLDLTRISRGKIELHCEAVDAHSALRNALEICQADIEAKSLEVSMGLWARQHHVWADPARLQQVLWNLLKNAVKFTPQGGRISLRSRNVEPVAAPNPAPNSEPGTRNSELPVRPSLIMEVADTGIGIDAEALPRIFNAFEQGERTLTRRFGGLGLGLAISKALVDMHKYKLTAASEGKERGSTFTLEMATVPAVVEERPEPPAAPRAAHKGLKILLVEDHEDTLRVMCSLLRRFGYDVKGAAGVGEALRIASGEKFDLLISDLGLPDGSGLDIMREVKLLYHMKGIALSGFGMDEDLRRSREAGFAEHLTKPVNFQALETVIRRVSS